MLPVPSQKLFTAPCSVEVCWMLKLDKRQQAVKSLTRNTELDMQGKEEKRRKSYCKCWIFLASPLQLSFNKVKWRVGNSRSWYIPNLKLLEEIIKVKYIYLFPEDRVHEEGEYVPADLEVITEEPWTSKGRLQLKIPHTGDKESLDRCGS